MLWLCDNKSDLIGFETQDEEKLKRELACGVHTEPIPPETSPLPGHGPAGCSFRKFVRWPAGPRRPHL